ncbi:MAG TPA: Minf_1886 family protein [Pirellulaceae bacterium]
MNPNNSLMQLIRDDPRYRLEAYVFVSEALAYAQEVLRMGGGKAKSRSRANAAGRHLSGQQLCEAIRLLAIEQFGYLTPAVLRSWGVTRTGDFGEIVYNLIKIGKMKKSTDDRREDFEDVYDFDEVFRKSFRMTAVPKGADD